VLRLFLALDLPVAVRRKLARWRDADLGGGGALRDGRALRPVAEEALHVTLVFLGATPEADVAELWGEVEAALGRSGAGAGASGRSGGAGVCGGHADGDGTLRAPRLTPVGIVAVPRGRPRLFALDLADEGGRAGELHGRVTGRLAAAGLHEPERRPFWPHVTLARVRRGPQRPRWAPGTPLMGPFTAPSLTLYRSHLSPAGSRYEALQSRRLG